MGTTLTAFSGEGASIQIVAAVEGYPYLLTDGDPSAAVTAWAATDWTQALSGLSVMWGIEQGLDPWASQIDVPTLTFKVMDYDGNDVLGKSVGAPLAGNVTESAVVMQPSRTKVPAENIDDFASSGHIYIGPEAIGYTSKFGTHGVGSGGAHFVGCTRGKWAPFKAGSESSQRFARYHSAENLSGLNTKLKIADAPRSWTGRLVGVWIHTKSDSGLNTRAEAHLAFAGRIVNARDQKSGETLFDCEDIRATIRDTVIMRRQWSGTVTPGIWVSVPNATTGGKVRQEILTVLTAFGGAGKTTTLYAVNRPPENEYEIERGFYSHAEFEAKVNAWLAKARGDSNAFYTITLSLIGEEDGGQAVRWTASHTSAIDPSDYFQASTPWGYIGEFVGGDARQAGILFTSYGDGVSRTVVKKMGNATTLVARSMVPQDITTGRRRIRVHNTRGVWSSTTANAPTSLSSPFGGASSILKFSDGSVFWAQRVGDNGFDLLAMYGESRSGFSAPETVRMAAGVELTCSQVMVFEGPFWEIMTRLLCSTGEIEYNGDHDRYPLDFGCAIPWELLGDDWLNTVKAVGESSGPMMVVLDKPTRLWDLIRADLVLRRMNIIFKAESLIAASWSIPTSETGLLTLSESNKSDDSATPSEIETKHIVTHVKILYGRTFSGDFNDHLTIADEAAVSETGISKAITIEARSLHRALPNMKDIVAKLAANVAAWLPIVSRPFRMIRRTVDLGYMLNVGPGDHAYVTDSFVRDPSTGERGITNQPALVFRHRWDPGGDQGSDIAPMTAEVDLALIPMEHVSIISPSAEVDDTADSGGFSSGYNAGSQTLRCYAHKYSESTQGVDASFFDEGDMIVVEELDSEAPLDWNDEVASVSGNDIVLVGGLAGWDATKKYKIYSRTFSAASTTQRAKVYTASDDDKLIQDLAPAYRWGVAGTSSEAYTSANLETDPVRLVFANRLDEDGQPLDAGTEFEICRLLNAAVNYRCAPAGGMQFKIHDMMSESTTPYVRELIGCYPIFLGEVPAGYMRRLWVSVTAQPYPSAGIAAYWVDRGPQVRITLSATPPTGAGMTTSEEAVLLNTWDRPLYWFTGASSTLTWSVAPSPGSSQNLAEQWIDTRILGSQPFGFITIEASPWIAVEAISRWLGPLEVPV